LFEVVAFAEDLVRLKRQFLELLEKDKEFRLAVAGYLELSEALKSLESIEKNIEKLWESTNKLWENVNKLWEEVRAMRVEMRGMNVRLERVERTLEKLTLEIEEEARIVIKHRLREMGYEVEVTLLTLPEVEVNIYGVSGDLCVVGEARVRASSGIIDEIDKKIEVLKRLYPDKLRPRILRVAYTTLALPDLVARAEREGVWVLRAVGDVVKPKL
jgi:archaellum component FlaC